MLWMKSADERRKILLQRRSAEALAKQQERLNAAAK
jgi:hypothetical protein